MPDDRTPAPAMMNGARACTTSIDPCSPRWPPWSSQLWAAVWITHRSGAHGMVEQLGRLLVRERIAVGAAVGLQASTLVRQTGEPIRRLVGQGIPAVHRQHRAVAVEPHGTIRRVRLERVAVAHQHDLDDRLERRIEQDAERVADISGCGHPAAFRSSAAS